MGWMIQRSSTSMEHKKVTVTKREGIAYVIHRTILFAKVRASVDVSQLNKSSSVASSLSNYSNASGAYDKTKGACSGSAYIEFKDGSTSSVNPFSGISGEIMPVSSGYTRGKSGLSRGTLTSIKTPMTYVIQSISNLRVFQPKGASNDTSKDRSNTTG